ncbi:unnamed protein product [Symbiodinium necroappetens]|uniref:Cytochrome b6-f complex subunit PetN n=1 Tax=Symbiodinium necroappetens TaxID=1628268 RepID=A0A812NK09_9DINO|nr:unnamed protein product [Symbiodinium necroappetens]
MARRSPLAVIGLALCAWLLCAPAFVGPLVQAPEVASAAHSAASQVPEIASSVALADLSPLENPNITFVVLLSMFSMSIALVVWGRNGF